MKFSYVGISSDQTVAKGDIQASSEREARAQLEADDIDVILVKKKKFGFLDRELSFGRVSRIDLLFFVKHLGIMLKAGIPLFEALTMLKEQASGRLKAVLNGVILEVSAGKKLSDSLRKHTKDFPELIVQLIYGGEISGTLEESLEYVAEFLRKEIELRKKIRSAMLYPGLIAIAIFGLAVSIGLFVLPQIIPLFKSMDVELPPMTRALLWMAEFTKVWGVLFFSLIFLVIVITPIILESRFVRPISHRIYLRIPFVGKVIRESALARFFLIFSTLMQAGVEIDKSLQVSSEIIYNCSYKKAIKNMEKSLVQGDSIVEAAQRNLFLFPAIVTHMMRVGEKSGNLVDSLKYLGSFYEQEVDDKLKNLGALLEPLLLVIIGIVVGLVAFAIIGPLYSLTGNIR